MHKLGIAHRDLKPENILLKRKVQKFGDSVIDRGSLLAMEVKICDLGAAKVLDKEMNTPYVVSRYYRAPELILGAKIYDCSIDVWAAGCILFELLTRTPLFPGESEAMQVLEAAEILGMPNSEELESLK